TTVVRAPRSTPDRDRRHIFEGASRRPLTMTTIAPSERHEMAKSRPVAAVILAAGQGTRMKSARPKVAFEICGWPMVRHVVEAVRPLEPARTVVVVGHGRKEVESALDGVPGMT